MIIHKITTGYVIQIFDEETQRFISQKFIPYDVVYGGENNEVNYETSEGEPITDEEQTGVHMAYLPFDMIQPIGKTAEEKLREIEELITESKVSPSEMPADIMNIINSNL